MTSEDGPLMFLESHLISCKNLRGSDSPITRFRYNDTSQSYDFNCDLSGVDMVPSQVKQLRTNWVANATSGDLGGLVGLDVDCPQAHVLTQFRVETLDQSKIRYNYQCISYPRADMTCREGYTEYQSKGKQFSLAGLALHDVHCNANEALKGFGVDESADSLDDIRYHFECCTAKPLSTPSNSPTVVPTLSPTPESTTLAPSVSPTIEPISTPTKVPTLVPSAMPSSFPVGKPTMFPSVKPIIEPLISPHDSMSTHRPTYFPTPLPPSPGPSVFPTLTPTAYPTWLPTLSPSAQPSQHPSLAPVALSTFYPSVEPTSNPVASPTFEPTQKPVTKAPSFQPTTKEERVQEGEDARDVQAADGSVEKLSFKPEDDRGWDLVKKHYGSEVWGLNTRICPFTFIKGESSEVNIKSN